MEKVVLTCKPGYSFGPSLVSILRGQGFVVRQKGERIIEVEPGERAPLGNFFTPRLGEAWGKGGVIITEET